MYFYNVLFTLKDISGTEVNFEIITTVIMHAYGNIILIKLT